MELDFSPLPSANNADRASRLLAPNMRSSAGSTNHGNYDGTDATLNRQNLFASTKWLKQLGVSATFRCPARIAILLLILAAHTLMLGLSAWRSSPTLDEPAHLAAGLRHWRSGDFSLYRVNPPLIRMVATIPVVVSKPEMHYTEKPYSALLRPEFLLGEEFVKLNGRNALWLTTFGRWACIPFSWLGALVCYVWARDLFGAVSGVLAISLWCFSPMVLGHASLLTPDAHAASLGLAVCYTFWRWLRAPTWRLAITTGVLLGIAELAKTTLILLYPIWPVLWIIYRIPERSSMTWRRWRDEGLMLAARMVIGIYVINLGYLGNGSFVQLKDYTFISQLFRGQSKVANEANQVNEPGTGNRFQNSALGLIPVPLPYDYLSGIDCQQRDFEDFGRPSYLRGVFQEKGWWYYYFYAILVKAPLGTLGLFVLALAFRLVTHTSVLSWRDEMVLLAPAVIVLVIVSSKTGFSHHLRYIFPAIPFLLVWVSQAASYPRRLGRVNLARNFLISWSILSSLWQYPHSIAYFNESACGPLSGAGHLLNSNIDWGQDLLYLEEWIQARGGNDSVYLAFDDCLNPFDFGIKNTEPWPFAKEPEEGGVPPRLDHVPAGFYAISINQLYEFPWPLCNRVGTRYFIDQRPLGKLRAMRPVGYAGYSIRVFSASQVEAAYSLTGDSEKR